MICRDYVRFLAIVAMSCLLAPLPTLASTTHQDDLLEQDIGSWNQVTLQLPIYRKLSGYLETQPRWQKLAEHKFTELILRNGLFYDINKHCSIGGGHYFTAMYNPHFATEQRVWQQANLSHSFGKLKLQDRIRCEEKYRESWVGASVIFRNQIRLTYPIRKSHWYVAVSEEPIFNLNTPDHGPLKGFNQNRLFLGLGRQVNQYTRLECGYLNQYKNGRHGKPDRINHVLVAQVSIDLRKIKVPHNWRLANLFRPHHTPTPAPEALTMKGTANQ